MSLLSTIAAFVVALGSLIVIHELGHYLMARGMGVKVLRFSVGFGRPIFSRRFGRDGTEWVLAAFPLGGYVKMLDEREAEVPMAERARAFNRQTVYRRFAIVSAGPIANFLLAILIYWALFIHGMPGLRPVVGDPPPNTVAQIIGVQGGETIVSIDGQAVTTWQDARWALLRHAVNRSQVKVEFADPSGRVAVRLLDFSGITASELDGDFLRPIGLVRFTPRLPAVLGHLVKGGPAERAGLREGDLIVAVDGNSVQDWQEVVNTVRNRPGQGIEFNVQRGRDQIVGIIVRADAVTEGGQQIGRIGAAPRMEPTAFSFMQTEVRYGALDAIGQAIVKTWDMSIFSLRMLGKMLLGQISLKNLSGPITIADYAGQTAQVGWVAYLGFVALISISLGVLNLLPIPLLDGGHLMYYTVEILKGSPVSERAMQLGQHVGMAVLFTLMLLALYNDVSRLISN